MENCYFLNQRNYSISGALKGVRCNKEATVEEAKNGRIYHFCAVHSYTADRFVGAGDWAMNKRIEVTEYQCSPTTFDLGEFIKAQCFDAEGNHIMPEDGGMRGYEIDRLMNLAIGESMPLGDPESGLTVVRLTDKSGHEHLGHAGPGRKCDAPACKLTPDSLCLRVSTQLYPYKG